MKSIVNIRGVLIGDGAPKICVPMVGKTIYELKEEAEYLKSIDLDIAEWRVDFFKDVKDIPKVKDALKVIRSVLADMPLLFTLRSAKEGGQIEMDRDYYFQLNKSIVETKFVDAIDVELFNLEEDVKELVKAAHKVGVFVIISNHNFNKTPEKEEIISRLCRAQELGADISKIAVMPNCTEDVITLLDATRIMKEVNARGPIITMSMASKGVITRISGEVFGSDITFGAAKKNSAPGQISVEDLRNIIQLLHKNL